MASTLEPLPRKHRLTVGDYHRMAATGILAQDARVELIEGEIIDMTPIGSAHAGQVSRLNKILTIALAERAVVHVQNPLVLDAHTEPEPDLMVLKPRSDFYAARHPRPEDVLLLVEVADTSLEYDRGVKLPLYAVHGIPEVWLVDLAGRRLLVHRDPVGKAYRYIVTPESLDALAPAALPDVGMDLSGLFR